jgi:hypothetical protein
MKTYNKNFCQVEKLLTGTVRLEVLGNQNVETRLGNTSMDVNERRVLVDVEEADIGIGSFWSGSCSSTSGWNEWNNSTLQTMQKKKFIKSAKLPFNMIFFT